MFYKNDFHLNKFILFVIIYNFYFIIIKFLYEIAIIIYYKIQMNLCVFYC